MAGKVLKMNKSADNTAPLEILLFRKQKQTAISNQSVENKQFEAEFVGGKFLNKKSYKVG